jgi:hypothetical protein
LSLHCKIAHLGYPFPSSEHNLFLPLVDVAASSGKQSF